MGVKHRIVFKNDFKEHADKDLLLPSAIAYLESFVKVIRDSYPVFIDPEMTNCGMQIFFNEETKKK